MTGMLALCASMAAVGVDYGWQPVAGGGIEYIIQIEPQMLDSLRAGQDIFSDLPRTASNIRTYRITSGTGPLPHHGEPLPLHEVNRPGSGTHRHVGPSLRGTAEHVADAEDAAHEQPAGAVAAQQPDEAEEDRGPLPGPVLGPALSLAADEVEPDRAEPDRAEPRAPDGGKSQRGHPPRRLADPPSKPLEHRAAAAVKKTSIKPAVETSGQSQRASAETAGSQPSKPTRTKKKDSVPSGAGKAATTPTASTTSDQRPTRPSFMLLGLFASVGCNVFLLWIATGQRSRYRALARQAFGAPAS
jgi:hypothetical protein